MAYEEELRQELEKLSAHFDEWRAGKIGSGDLSILIHEYDRGPSRRMYDIYNNEPAEVMVGYALSRGYLSREDIPEAAWPYVEGYVSVHTTYKREAEE